MNIFPKNKITLPLLAIIVARIFQLLWLHQTQLTTTFDPILADFIYQHSQFNLGNAEFLGNIDDDLLYQYSGYRYIHGTDPSLLSPEVPFVGKYLYGLSIIFFGNATVIQFIFSLSVLFTTFWLTKTLTKSTTAGLLASGLLLTDKLFLHQSFTTLLDLPHALWINFTFICFAYWLGTKKPKPHFLLLTSVFIGLTATTKLFISAILLWLSILVFIPKTKHHFLRLTLPAVFTYLLSHAVFFYHHPNPIDFFTLHLDTAKLYRSYLPEYPWGQFLNIILFGRWLTWWGQGEINVSHWSLLWPTTTLATIGAGFYYTRMATYSKPSSLKSFLLSPPTHPRSLTPAICLFICLYILSNLTHVVFPRYLLSVLPLAISLTTSIAFHFFSSPPSKP